MQEGDHWILGHMDWGTHFPVIVFTAYALVGNSFYIHVHVHVHVQQLVITVSKQALTKRVALQASQQVRLLRAGSSC